MTIRITETYHSLAFQFDTRLVAGSVHEAKPSKMPGCVLVATDTGIEVLREGEYQSID